MPRVTWDVSGERLYQAGLDRGMLYTEDSSVPWIGLISVTESPSGGSLQSYHVDGRKILDIPAKENFGATIEAFAVPVEFASCAGRMMLSPALYVTDQPREIFGFSYRTLIGNDIQGDTLGYKVHLVYNASAKIGDFSLQTMTDSPQPVTRSVDINTFPIVVPGYRPSAHFVFNTLINSSDTITDLETIIYGDSSNDPRMPTPSELAGLLLT